MPPGDKAQLCEACYADVDAGRDKEIVDRYVKNQEAKGRRMDEVSFRLEEEAAQSAHG
jgi:hypothetical protein